MRGLSRICSVGAGLIALISLAGYLSGLSLLVHLHAGLAGMSPLTLTAVLALSVAGVAQVAARDAVIHASTASAAAIALVALGSHAVFGADVLGPAIGRALFHMASATVGRTSTATAIGILLIALGLVTARRRPLVSDTAGGAALVLSGTALLGYLYGVGDLYALPIFNTMALNTAAAIALLAVATLCAHPELGWAAIIGSEEAGGGATRRQLAIILLPIAAGWALLRATEDARLGPAVAMALLVMVTIVPFAILILRDGHILNSLERERATRIALQDRIAADMERRLSSQADALAHESEERTKAEAGLYHAQKLQAVGQLAGGIAHDFNNLLMAVHGNLELLQRKMPASDDRLRRYVDNAMEATDRGAKVTGQLLAFSRSQRLNIGTVELDVVLRSARDLIGSAMGPLVTIEIALDTQNTWVTTDPDQLELAILNLAVNARDAMPDGGRLRLETGLRADRVGDEAAPRPLAVVRLIDSGTGMTPEIIAKATEPFFTTKERGKGTGLGLSQVYGFARQSGGDLRIISAPERGTTIEILLPCTARPEVGVASGGASASSKRQPLVFDHEVLVIDDDDAVRAVIVDALEGVGFTVLQASDGASGLALLETSTPAAAVIDFLMPGMNGAEVARIAQTRRPGLPIVFVSGYSDTIALDGIAGAVVLRKPFDIDGLSRALSSVLH